MSCSRQWPSAMRGRAAAPAERRTPSPQVRHASSWASVEPRPLDRAPAGAAASPACETLPRTLPRSQPSPPLPGTVRQAADRDRVPAGRWPISTPRRTPSSRLDDRLPPSRRRRCRTSWRRWHCQTHWAVARRAGMRTPTDPRSQLHRIWRRRVRQRHMTGNWWRCKHGSRCRQRRRLPSQHSVGSYFSSMPNAQCMGKLKNISIFHVYRIGHKGICTCHINSRRV